MYIIKDRGPPRPLPALHCKWVCELEMRTTRSVAKDFCLPLQDDLELAAAAARKMKKGRGARGRTGGRKERYYIPPPATSLHPYLHMPT
jgi:hypothetical protein